MKKFLSVIIVVAVIIVGYALLTGGEDWKKGTQSFAVTYDHVPKDTKDWTISTAVKNDVLRTMNCSPLQGTGAYLPVDREKPMRCGVAKSKDGVVSAYVIGLGRPDGGTSYPDAMIVVFGNSGATIYTKVAKFPETEALANDKVAEFTATHTQAVIVPPDDNAKKLYADVEKIVTDAVRTPSVEVIDQMQKLKEIAENIKAD